MKKLKVLLVVAIATLAFVSCGNNKKPAPIVEEPVVEVKKPDPIRKTISADAWKNGTPYFYIAEKANNVEVETGEVHFTAGEQVYIVALPEGYVVSDKLVDGTTVWLKGTIKGANKQLVIYGDPANKDKSIVPNSKAHTIAYKDNKGKAKPL